MADVATDPSFRVSEAARSAARDFWKRHALDGKRVVAVQPSAGAGLKSWPVDRWARLADALIERGTAPLLVGGPDDAALLTAIEARMSGRPAAGAGGQSLSVSAAIYERCALLVGLDGGGAHLAAAVGIPTVRLYGPAPSDVFGPWPPHDDQRVLVADGLACVPCGQLEGAALWCDDPSGVHARPGRRRRAECRQRRVGTWLESWHARHWTEPDPGGQAGQSWRSADHHAGAARSARRSPTRISVSSRHPPVPGLRGLDTYDEVITFDKFAFDRPTDALRSLPAALGLAAELRPGDWQTLVLLHHLTTPFGIAKYAALALGSGARRRVGLDNGRGRWFLTDSAVDRGFGWHHEVDYCLDVVGVARRTSSESAPTRAVHRA